MCEADQTRVLDDDEIEEEGAVGGILESPQSVESTNKQVRYKWIKMVLFMRIAKNVFKTLKFALINKRKPAIFNHEIEPKD